MALSLGFLIHKKDSYELRTWHAPGILHDTQSEKMMSTSTAITTAIHKVTLLTLSFGHHSSTWDIYPKINMGMSIGCNGKMPLMMPHHILKHLVQVLALVFSIQLPANAYLWRQQVKAQVLDPD